MYTVGIDPGSSGGIVALDPRGSKIVQLYDMPTFKTKTGTCLNENEFLDMLGSVCPPQDMKVYIEQVNAHAVPKGQMTAAFSFGAYYHSARVLVGAYGASYEFISPMVWKKAMDVQGKGPAGKEIARAKAIQLWPTWSKKFVKSRDGRSDAALIAEAGRRLNG